MIGRQWLRQEHITVILVSLALMVITGIDLFLLPHQNVTVLYMIPVLIAALRTRPRVVGGIAATTLVVDFINASARHDLTQTWPIRTIVLVVAYSFAILLALQRQELDRRSNELGIARVRLQSILENAPDAILYVETGSDRLVANPRAVQLFGVGVEQSPGTSQFMRQFRTQSGEGLGDAEWPSQRALHGEVVSDEELLVERPDGERVPVLVSAAPVCGPGDRVIGVVIVAQDISTIRELERQREEWISVIAHDLRQPITMIVGYAGILERQTTPYPSLQRAVERVLLGARQMNRMIADLLDVSRLEASRLSLLKERVELPSLVRAEVEHTVQVTAGHPVQVEIQGEIPPLSADPDRLRQILTNLLSNAAKYSYPGCPIGVRLECRDDSAELTVINRGPGIAPDEMAHLFTRFYRTSEARLGKIGGIGLGLYITKGLVEAHGGRIWVESVPGQTTAFHVLLPLDRAVGGARDYAVR